MSDELIAQALESDIGMTHERFVAAMAERLPTMTVTMKERYFVVMSTLVGKLEDPDKPLRKILEEMMMEAGSLIMQELQSST